MKLRKFSDVEIRAVCGALPAQHMDQAAFAQRFGEKEVARICQNTGIYSKSVAGELTTSQLMVAASVKLLSEASIERCDVDALVTVTQTPDSWSPGVGFHVHGALGLSQDCSIFDLNAGCAGYITALLQASTLISSGAYQCVLVCTGDVTTKLLNPEDRHVALLFGDGASATLLCKGRGQLSFICANDGQGHDTLGTRLSYTDAGVKVHDLHMDGAEVMNFALAKVPSTIKTLLDRLSLQKSDVDQYIFHQANAFMLNYLQRILKLTKEQVAIDIDGIGNTSSSSIPLVMSRSNTVGTPLARNMVLCGFGVGLSWGALHADLSHTQCISPVILDEPSRATLDGELGK